MAKQNKGSRREDSARSLTLGSGGRGGDQGQPSRDERGRDAHLGFLIHDLSRLRKRAFDEFMRPLGITRSQWWIIANLARNDGMVQTQFADMLDLGKASLGFTVDRLEANGLIERHAHPSDRRAKCIYLTKKARQLLSKMLSAQKSYDELVLRKLSSEEREELIGLLEKVKQTLLSIQPSRAAD